MTVLKLHQASRFFNFTPAYDADTNAFLFKGHLKAFDGTRRDSSAAYRRILTVEPGVVPSLAIRLLNTVYLVGVREEDGYAAPHRWRYVVQPVERKFGVTDLAGFLARNTRTTYWGLVEWFKDVKQIEVDSTLPAVYMAVLPKDADVQVRDILLDEKASYLVLETHEAAGGFLEAMSLKLESAAPEIATISGQVYNPRTGRYTTSTGIEYPALRVRWQSLFSYGSEADAKYLPGDITIVLPTLSGVTTTSKIVLAGRTWKVITIDTLGAVIAVHARPA